MWLQCGRYTLLVFDGIDERPLSGRHVLLRRNPSDQDLLPSNRSFCLFPTSFVGRWNPEIVCCVYFHPSRLVEIPRGLNLGNISHVSLKNPTSATLLTCSSHSLTDPERNCWRLKFENALSIPPITNQPWKFGKNIYWRVLALFCKSSRYPINATLMTSNRDVYCSVCVPVN